MIDPMAAEPMEIRMARLEGTYARINERLGVIENRLGALEQRPTSEIAGLRSETASGFEKVRRQMTGRFYWLLTLIIGSILIPILRDFIR
jgi:hypothetical protein